ncbi:MAG: TIGR02099 family protein, partial [Proteobacteria bacterium]|nr:TIGR02099 family protein [Burkholderiales bacterium]
GEFTANSLALEPWVALAEQLPIDARARALLTELGPRGHLDDVSVAWAGPFDALDTWSVKGRFTGLAVHAHDAWPGIVGFTGSVDGNQRGGTLNIASNRFVLDLPKVFANALVFDSVGGQVAWTGRGPSLALRVANLALANADLAGAVSGEYRFDGSPRGYADLTGALSRIEAKAIAAYLPLNISQGTRNWFARALQGGRGTDVRMRLKGDLAGYPFPAGGRERGQFLVTARVEDGELDYATGWPRITDLAGDVAFRANRVEMSPRSATVGGIALQRVQGVIADISQREETLELTGEAESATADVLRFITQSPIDTLLDGATRQIDAQGRGRLALRLNLPLRRIRDTTVAGSYQFVNNRLVVDRESPPLDAVNGRLEFSESALRVNGATAQWLGGPTTINVASQRDGTMRIGVTGRASAESLRRELPEAWGQALRGAADWRATLTYRRKLGDLLVESSLVGLAIDLPPPFNKAAADALPLRFERVSGVQRDRFTVSLAGLASAQVLRRTDGDAPTIERATLAIGALPAPAPERRGLSISGSLKQVNLDAWLPLLRTVSGTGTGTGAAGAGSAGALDLGDIDLRLGQVELIGRRFNDVAVRTSPQPGGWQGTVASKEVSGEVAWRSQGRGRLTARLKQVNLPASTATAAVLQQAKLDDTALPALDVTVESFLLADKLLGRLELVAFPEARDWRIERLRVVNPDATFQMEGLWQSWMSQPRTQANVRLDIVDGGKLLARLGYPEGLRGGGGRIEGPLSWAGSPQDLDLATLSGNLMVELNRGQFVRLEPGVGRLLGVFNLQNLPRRIALDFRDVFTEGFSFDEIAGSMRVARGVGRLDNFRIQGPSARVLMSGEINLPKETQNLQVRVTPALGDSLALAGALIGGPIAGLASFLVQRVLKDPLAQFATFDYAITGTWAEPAVNRVSRPESRPESSPEPAPSRVPG